MRRPMFPVAPARGRHRRPRSRDRRAADAARGPGSPDRGGDRPLAGGDRRGAQPTPVADRVQVRARAGPRCGRSRCRRSTTDGCGSTSRVGRATARSPGPTTSRRARRSRTPCAACRDPRTGEPVVADVLRLRAEDPMDPEGPDADLQFIWSHATDSWDHPKAGLIGPFPYRRTGGHSRKGFAVFAGPGIEPGDLGERNALDLTPTLLDLLGRDARLPTPASRGPRWSRWPRTDGAARPAPATGPRRWPWRGGRAQRPSRCARREAASTRWVGGGPVKGRTSARPGIACRARPHTRRRCSARLRCSGRVRVPSPANSWTSLRPWA